MSTSSENDVLVFLFRRLKFAILDTLKLLIQLHGSFFAFKPKLFHEIQMKSQMKGVQFYAKQSTLLESLQTSQLRWVCPKNASYARGFLGPKNPPKWLLAFWSYVACTVSPSVSVQWAKGRASAIDGVRPVSAVDTITFSEVAIQQMNAISHLVISRDV